MFLKFVVMMSRKSCLSALLLVVAAFVPAVPATSKTASSKNVSIKICVKDEQGKTLSNISVTLKGGTNDAGPWKTDGSGCTTKQQVPLNINKTYSLEIKAQGYKPAQESELSLTAAEVDNGGRLVKTITLAAAANPDATPPPSSSPTPLQKPEPAQEQTLQQVKQAIWIQTVILSALGLMLLLVLCTLLWIVKSTINSIQIIENEVHKNLPENLKGILQTSRDSLKEVQATVDAARTEALAAAGQSKGSCQTENRPPESQHQPTTKTSEQTYVDPGRPNYLASTPRVFTDAVAQEAYGALIDGRQVAATPIYLGVEASSSPEDMFGNNKVQLKETPHGTFVLLRGNESDESGWVFPNPRLAFDLEALKPIFPGVSADNFKSDKKSIRPKQVTQVGSGRWVVG